MTTIATIALAEATLEPPRINALPYLSIERVQQIDNLDQGDALGADRADFYAMVTVNGVSYKTEVIAKDDGWPNWQIPLDYTTRVSTIHIRLMDDDGGLERKDDHADINPRKNMKDLTFKYDRWTGKVSGQVSGKLNRAISSEGGGDDDKAKISFMIAKV